MSEVYAQADERCADYLTPRRAYLVLREDESGEGFYITNDTGTESYCLWRLCAHLSGDGYRGSWTRLERPASADTHPKDGDVKQAPLGSGATAQPGRTNPSSTPPQANNQ